MSERLYTAEDFMGGPRITDYREPASGDLILLPAKYRAHPNSTVKVERKAYAAYLALKQRAEKAGFKPNIFTITSAFRSYKEQEALWNKALKKYGTAAKARVWVAPPGTSTHQTGRALDLWLGAANDSSNVARLSNTQAFRWISANARSVGFYPYEAEPWHWEWIEHLAPSQPQPTTPRPPAPPPPRPPAPVAQTPPAKPPARPPVAQTPPTRPPAKPPATPPRPPASPPRPPVTAQPRPPAPPPRPARNTPPPPPYTAALAAPPEDPREGGLGGIVIAAGLLLSLLFFS